LALIAAALREFVRDNDLGVSVDRCLCVIGLDDRNNSPSAFKWRLRKSLIVRKSGGSSATIITKSFRSRQALAMRRHEYSPLA
jgi:hypothetical protein